MAEKGWTARVATAAGSAAGTGAAQLGLGYGLGVIVWPATPAPDDSIWLGSLGWATWIAASATVIGAVISSRVHGDRATRLRGPWRFALAISAAVGALVAVALIALPARSAVRSDTFSPQVTAAGYAILGILLGLVVAYWAVVSRPVAANLIGTAAWLWALAIAAVVVELAYHRDSATYLTSWQFTEAAPADRYGMIYWPTALLTLSAAFLIGVIAATPSAFRGDRGAGAATSGAVGPLLVAASFLALAPRLGDTLGPLESAYLIAPYAVLAGLAGSALTVSTARSSADRRARRAAARAAKADQAAAAPATEPEAIPAADPETTTTPPPEKTKAQPRVFPRNNSVELEIKVPPARSTTEPNVPARPATSTPATQPPSTGRSPAARPTTASTAPTRGTAGTSAPSPARAGTDTQTSPTPARGTAGTQPSSTSTRGTTGTQASSASARGTTGTQTSSTSTRGTAGTQASSASARGAASAPAPPPTQVTPSRGEAGIPTARGGLGGSAASGASSPSVAETTSPAQPAASPSARTAASIPAGTPGHPAAPGKADTPSSTTDISGANRANQDESSVVGDPEIAAAARPKPGRAKKASPRAAAKPADRKGAEPRSTITPPPTNPTVAQINPEPKAKD